MRKTTTTLDQRQMAETLQYLLRLQAKLKNAPPKELTDALKRIHKSRAIGELADSSFPMLFFFRISVPLYGRQDPMTMGELSKLINTPISSATRMVDWLVQYGYAERSSDPLDRRVVRVGLTQTGRELYGALTAMVSRRIEKITNRLTSAERKQFATLLARIVEIIETEE